MMRACVSATPPAGHGTTQRMVRVGYRSAAHDKSATSSSPSASPSERTNALVREITLEFLRSLASLSWRNVGPESQITERYQNRETESGAPRHITDKERYRATDILR